MTTEPDDRLAADLARLGELLDPGPDFAARVMQSINDLPAKPQPQPEPSWFAHPGPWLYAAAQVLIIVLAGSGMRPPEPHADTADRLRRLVPELSAATAEYLAGRSGLPQSPWPPPRL